MMSEAVKPWAEGEGAERLEVRFHGLIDCDHHYVPTRTVRQWTGDDIQYMTKIVERMTCRKCAHSVELE